MKHLKSFRVFENNKQFYKPDSETLKKLQDWIQKKMTSNPDLDLQQWIYSNIIRKKGQTATEKLRNWIKNKSNTFKGICDSFIKQYPKNDFIEAAQDSQNEWIGFNFNKNLKEKTVSGSTKLTYNLYLTFEETEENLTNWVNGINDLITRFYNSCKDVELKDKDVELKDKDVELKDSAISLKFGYELNHYISDYDHLKFYWYKKEDESKIEKIVKEWLNKNKIKTVERPYDKGFDPETSAGKSSWGVKVSEEVNKAFEDLLIQTRSDSGHGYKFSAKQYADWIVDMLNTTKFKF
jgi:hypothetical protein